MEREEKSKTARQKVSLEWWWLWGRDKVEGGVGEGGGEKRLISLGHQSSVTEKKKAKK